MGHHGRLMRFVRRVALLGPWAANNARAWCGRMRPPERVDAPAPWQPRHARAANQATRSPAPGRPT